MKKMKRRALYIIAALLGALFVLSCLMGFAACGGGSGDDGEEGDHTHSYTSSVTTEPTCTEKGVRTYVCSCGDSYTEEIDALGHDYKGEVTKNATCGDPGETTYTCSRCKDTYTAADIEATGNHTWGAGVETTAATCTEAGVKTYTCSVCGETKTEAIAALGHSYVESTDESDGYKDPTCTEEGVSVKICSRCNDKQTEPIAALGHDLTITPIDATCTTGGFVIEKCSRCGYEATEYVDALGHDYVEDTDDSDYKAATCTESGTSVKICSRCGDRQTETIPATGHTWDEGQVTKEATIYEAGMTTYTCTVCQTTRTEEIPQLTADDYTSNFLTGDLSKVDESYVTYTNWEDKVTSAQFAGSEIDVEFDKTTNSSEYRYVVSGTAAVMNDAQLKAFWGQTGYASHANAEYITIVFVAKAGEKFTITSEKSPNGLKIEGDADDTDDTFYTLVYDVSNWSEENTGETVFKITDDKGTYPVVIGDIELFTVVSAQEDLFAAVAEGGDVALTQDITLATEADDDASGSHAQKAAATLTIGDGTNDVEVTLDLNGYTLARNTQNTSGYQYNTIHVEKNATLIVTDSSEDGTGVVDVTGNYNEALYNEGTAILMGGLFTRSNENGMVESNNGGDSSYTIENYGDLTIDGATVYNAGDYSTCIRNQYTTDSSNPATLTMISGKVYGGKYAVGSGSSTSGRYATFTMTGGTLGGLRSDTDALPYRALNNYDQAIITGGTLLGGNGGAIDVNGANKADACVEGVVIFNEDGGTNHTLTIGDGNGNGPEIIYEGINPDGILPKDENDDDDQLEDMRLSYYDETTGNEIPAFATGIAVYSGEVDINAGTIKCTDTAANRDYNFMGVYLTNGTLNVSGGSISGDEAILIDCTAETSPEIAVSITGGTLTGNIVVYTTNDEGSVVSSVYTPGSVIVPSEQFEFNEGTFDGFSGLDEDFTVTDEDGEEITYTAGDITVTVTVESDGTITVVVDGIVANMMSDEQKVAFDASYAEEDGTIRFYIAVQVAVRPGETVTVTCGDKSETISNTSADVIYDLWVIEIGQSHFSDVTEVPADAYVVVDLSTSNFSMSVTVTDSDGSVTGGYTVTFGSIFLSQQAWKCANGNHTVSSWTVLFEETCGTKGLMVGTCDYCGKTMYEVVEATGNHDWNEGEVTTEPTCTGEGVLTKTCTVCGETTTETIPALGHTATTYSDGNMYAVYMNTAAEEEDPNYAWCALCEVCEEWFEIGEEDIYDFVLVAKDEDSLDAAIEVAGKRTDGSADNRTQILVYGEIEISEESYVLIDCDNVEIYGLGAEESKIIDSAYELNDHSSTARDGVEITGKNVTIRDLTIDGSKLDESANHYNYEHGLEILESAENVTLSNCVITGGTSENSSAVVLMNGYEKGYLLIENCTLSGYHGITIEHSGSDLNVTISGGTIDGSYYGILIDAGSGVYLNVVNAEVYGRLSLTGNTTSVIFTNCTLGFHISDSGSSAYGAVNAYCDVTLIGCTFLSHEDGTYNTDDPLVNTSNNYAIQGRTTGITIKIVDCYFYNTNSALESGKIKVTEDNFMYLVGTKSVNVLLYFSASEDAWEYLYDSTAHTVEHNHEWDDGVDDETTGKTTWTCEVCGATKTEVTGNHVVSATPSSEYVVTTEGDENFTTPTFTITMSNSDDDEGPTTYESIDAYLTDSGLSDSVTWTSSDESVATVDESGEITIVGTGTTTITVKFAITELEASYLLCVGEAIDAETDPLIGSWSGTDEVTIEELGDDVTLPVDVSVTVDEDGFTLSVSGSVNISFISITVNETIWDGVDWFKIGDDYYIVVEEADGSYETIDIHYDSDKDQLSTSFEFTFQYTLFITMDVTVDVKDATLSRVTASGESETPADEQPSDDGNDN